MSRLQLHGRPWVKFQASNPQHRRWFAEFKDTGTWSLCPVRFVVESNGGDLVTQIQQELLDFYLGIEFRKNSQRLMAA